MHIGGDEVHTECWLDITPSGTQSIDLLHDFLLDIFSMVKALGKTYHLHPTVRPRIEPKDEIERKNVRLADKLDSATITKTISGSFVN